MQGTPAHHAAEPEPVNQNQWNQNQEQEIPANAGRRPASKPEPKPKTERKPSGPAQEIVEAFRVALGIERLANYGRAVGTAQRLANAGVAAADVPDLFAFTVRSWRGQDVTLDKMLNAVDGWRAEPAMAKAHAANGNGHRPSVADRNAAVLAQLLGEATDDAIETDFVVRGER